MQSSSACFFQILLLRLHYLAVSIWARGKLSRTDLRHIVMLAQLREIGIETFDSLLVGLGEFGCYLGVFEHLQHLDGEVDVSTRSLSQLCNLI